MSRARAQPAPDSVSPNLSSAPSVFGASYKRQKPSYTPPRVLSERDSDGELLHPFHLSAATHLSPKRQSLQATVRRLKREEQRDRAEQTEETDKREGAAQQSPKASARAAGQQAGGGRRRPQTDQQPHPRQTAVKRQSTLVEQEHTSGAADGGRTGAAIDRHTSRPRASHTQRSPPSAARSTPPPTYSATMRKGAASHTHQHDTVPLLDDSFPSSSSSSSSSSSPLSPQRLLTEWVDRRIATKQRGEAREEKRWKTAIQRQLAQLLEQTATLQQASWSKRQSESEGERARVESAAQLEDRLDRLIGSWESAQQQQQQQQQRSETSGKRRRAMRRALQLSGSGRGAGEVRRSLHFDHHQTEMEKAGRTGKPTAEAVSRDIGEQPVDGWVRSEKQLIWLLQHSEVRA